MTDMVMPSAMVRIARYRWGIGRPSARSATAIVILRPAHSRTRARFPSGQPANSFRVPSAGKRRPGAMSGSARPGRSPHHAADATSAHTRRPAPSLLAREENDADATDQIFKGNIADFRQRAAIDRIVAIVAESEEMPIRDGVKTAIITIVEARERLVARAVRQSFSPAFNVILRAGAAGVLY